MKMKQGIIAVINLGPRLTIIKAFKNLYTAEKV